MEPEFLAADHEIKVVNINCMAVKDPKFVYRRMLDEMGYSAAVSSTGADKKDANMHALEALVLESSLSLSKKKKTLL